MRKLTTATVNMILALGVSCILVGLLFFVKMDIDGIVELQTWPLIMTVSGAVVFYLSLTVFKLPFMFFAGIFNVLTGTLFLFVTSRKLKYGIPELWPASIEIAALCLLFTGFAKEKKIKTAFGVPSLSLAVMGALFLLFSLDIIKSPFSVFISYWWPLFLAGLGALVVVIFLLQQNPVTDSHFPYEKDESDKEADTIGEIEKLSDGTVYERKTQVKNK